MSVKILAAPIPHRFLLVRCEVENAHGERSLRFVEYNQFRLWQYLMANKHNIVVQQAGMGLWLPESEWQAQSHLFERAGTSERVMRLHFEIFDPLTGLCDVIQRFVPNPDFQMVSDKLRAMLPADLLDSDQCVMTAEQGQSVIREASVPLDSLGRQLALANA